MKFLLALLISFPCFAQLGLRSPAYVAQLQRPAAAGGACAVFQTNLVGGFALDIEDNDQTYGGLEKWSNTVATTICGLTFKLSYAAGDITTIGYQGYIYEMSGQDLGTLRASSTLLLGTNSWSSTEVYFGFPTPFAVTVNTYYALVIGVTNRNAANFIRFVWDGTGNVVGTAENFWYNGVEAGANKTTPPWIKVWTQ